MALSIVNSVRIQAIKATCARFPAARRRGENALSTGWSRPATRVRRERAVRPWARPPQIVRAPRRVPLSRCKGARPTHAARGWRRKGPHSGRSRTRVLAHTGPIPGTRRQRSSRTRQTGLARHVVSRASSRAARRVLRHAIWAALAAWRRRGALPRRCCSAVRMATRGRRRARSAAVPPSARQALGGVRGESPPHRGPGHGRPGHRSWPTGRWPSRNRGPAVG